MLHTNVAPTSAQALAKISMPERATLADLIELTIAQLMREGCKDVSAREAREELHRRYGRFEEMSTMSGRIANLIAAKRLVRDKANTRMCKITGETIAPLSVPAKQDRMFY